MSLLHSLKVSFLDLFSSLIFRVVDIYPSNTEDWQPVECIMGIFDAFHASVGELMYRTSAKRALAERGVFFYDYFYNAPCSIHGFGTLRPLPLPPQDSPEWSVPTSETSECFKLKLHQEIQKCLRPNVANRQVRVSMFMPLHVFIDFFHDEVLRKTETMYVCKSESCLDFLDDAWDIQDCEGILCKVDKQSVVCKCMIASQNFIVSFHYLRWHMVTGHLVAMDQDLRDVVSNPLRAIEVMCQNQLVTVVTVRGSVTLRQVQEDLLNELDLNLPSKFVFKCNMRKVPCYASKSYCVYAHVLYILIMLTNCVSNIALQVPERKENTILCAQIANSTLDIVDCTP